jgi:hypothetical protein
LSEETEKSDRAINKSEDIFTEQTEKPQNRKKSGGAELTAYKIDPIKSGQADFRPELNISDLEDILRH